MSRRPITLVLLFLLLCGLLACAGDDGSPESTEIDSRRQGILRFITVQDSLVRAADSGVFEEASRVFDARVYPAESAEVFLSSWLATGQERYRDDAIRQLQYARSLEDTLHLHSHPPDLSGNAPFPLVSSNAQARLVVGYYVAWRTLAEPFYLLWADQALSALLALPLSEACWEGDCFAAWHFTYSRAPGHEPWSGCFVNPNQQAVLGLALSLLYHEPESDHHLNPTVGDLARQQLGAAVVMMDEQGRIPLSASGDDPGLYDTRYGHKTLFTTMWAQTLWQDPELQAKLERALVWVEDYNTDGGRTLRYYPDLVDGPVPDPIELYSRLPLVHFLGGDMEALDGALDEVWNRVPEYQGIQGGWVFPLACLKAMGVPQDLVWK